MNTEIKERIPQMASVINGEIRLLEQYLKFIRDDDHYGDFANSEVFGDTILALRQRLDKPKVVYYHQTATPTSGPFRTLFGVQEAFAAIDWMNGVPGVLSRSTEWRHRASVLASHKAEINGFFPVLYRFGGWYRPALARSTHYGLLINLGFQGERGRRRNRFHEIKILSHNFHALKRKGYQRVLDDHGVLGADQLTFSPCLERDWSLPRHRELLDQISAQQITQVRITDEFREEFARIRAFKCEPMRPRTFVNGDRVLATKDGVEWQESYYYETCPQVDPNAGQYLVGETPFHVDPNAWLAIKIRPL